MKTLINILLLIVTVHLGAGTLWAQEKSDSSKSGDYQSETLDKEIADVTSDDKSSDSLESITEGATENEIGGNDPFGTSGDGIGNPSPGDDIFD